MKKKILYGLLALVLIVDIIITATAGLRVSLYYGEGYSIKVSEKDTIDKADIEKIAKEVFEKDYLVQDLELFKDSAVIKVKKKKKKKIQVLVDKMNEKYDIISLIVTDLIRYINLFQNIEKEKLLKTQ